MDNFDWPEYGLLLDRLYILEVLDAVQLVLPAQNPKECDQYYEPFLDLDDLTEQLRDQDMEVSRHQSGPTPGRLRFAGGAPAELRLENCVVALCHVRRHATPTAPARAIASMYITRPLWPIVAFPSCMLQQSFLPGLPVRTVTGSCIDFRSQNQCGWKSEEVKPVVFHFSSYR